MLKYRSDIDGLRTIAVATVVAYHAGLPFFGGGYVGVDIFFVISGFLITGVITQSLETQRFRFTDFAARRIRRLLPALVPVLLVATLIAYVRLLPEDFDLFTQSLIGAATYTSNFVFLAQSDYFVEAADIKPLLHTWSLAVEEQFYLVAPVVFFLLSKVGSKRLMLPITLLLLIASLVSAELVLRSGAVAQAFYNPLLRSWELLAGAALSLSALRLPAGWPSALARLAGLILISFCTVFYTSQTPFPGLTALPVIVGTCLLLAASGAKSDPVGRLLEWSPVTYLGRLSYAIYLWHWPLLVLARLTAPHDWRATTGAILFSIALSALSYHLLEKPIRFGRILKSPARAFIFLAAFSVLGLAVSFGASNLYSAGIGRSGADDLTTMLSRSRNELAWFSLNCQKRLPGQDNNFSICLDRPDPDAPTLLILGDSHGEHLIPGVKARWQDANILTITDGGCKILLAFQNRKPECDAIRDAAFDSDIWQDIDHAIIALRWNKDFFENAIETARWMHELGITVWLVTPMPEYSPGISTLYASATDASLETLTSLSNENLKAWPFDVRQQLLERLGREAFIRVIDPVDLRCDTKASCQLFTPEGAPMTFDESHLTIEGSTWLVKQFPDILAAD